VEEGVGGVGDERGGREVVGVDFDHFDYYLIVSMLDGRMSGYEPLME
jgi:hypothetical protein